MPIENRNVHNQWLLATLFFGFLGVAGTLSVQQGTPVRDFEQSNRAPDQSDDLYPSPNDAISKKLGPWSDPFENVNGKLQFDPSAQGPSVVDLISTEVIDNGAKTPGRLLVIAKIVSGKEGGEGTESRRRHRHAVELALTSSGYSMTFPNRMTYAEGTYDYFHNYKNRTSQKKIDVPLKLYNQVNKNGSYHVLVMWIKDEHLGHRPLRAISEIVDSVLTPNPESSKSSQILFDHAAIAIVGPSSSNTLAQMVDESKGTVDEEHDLANFFAKWKKGSAIFNSSCTAPNESIGLSRNQQTLDLGETTQLLLVHMIGADASLIDLLQTELALRGRVSTQSTRTVLFVEERSQKYIDALKQSFLKNAKHNLTVVPYLRGIVADMDGGEHTSVADYMDRTFAKLRSKGAESVVAVGVFGTQWHDKLAIFRSARSAFPTAAYFTTELDARYSEPENYAACRNLLVVSHYGLGCSTELVGGGSQDMPTFRDGYQTAAFLSMTVLLSSFSQRDSISSSGEFTVGESPKQNIYDLWGRSYEKQSSPVLQPLAFEISRSGSFQIPSEKLPASYVVRHAPSTEPLFARPWFLFRLASCAVFLIGIGCITRSFSSELTDLQNRAWNTIVSVGIFFREIARFLRQRWTSITQPAVQAAGNAESQQGSSESSSDPSKGSSEYTSRSDVNRSRAPVDRSRTLWFVITLALTLLLFSVAWSSDISPTGEAVSWNDAISIWPSVLLFHIVSTISTYLIVRYFAVYDTLFVRKGLILAVLLLALIFFAMGFAWWDSPPARGWLARLAALVSLWCAAISLFALASLSTLSILKARKDIADCAKELQNDAPTNCSLLKKVEILLKNAAGNRGTLVWAMEAGERSSMTLIAPAALTIVLAVARLPLLDSWGVPRVWYVALMTPLVLSVLAALAMRAQARRLKTEVLESIEARQSNLLGEYSKTLSENPNATGTDELSGSPGESVMTTLDRERFNDSMGKVSLQVSLIRQLQRGPFGSVYGDPLLGGMLLILTAGLTGPMRELTTSLLSHIGLAS